MTNPYGARLPGENCVGSVKLRKNAFTTSRYWLQKLFLTLEGVQDDIVLSDTIS
jgi:hypothetical protein